MKATAKYTSYHGQVTWVGIRFMGLPYKLYIGLYREIDDRSLQSIDDFEWSSGELVKL